jgi:hypothetical protein
MSYFEQPEYASELAICRLLFTQLAADGEVHVVGRANAEGEAGTIRVFGRSDLWFMESPAGWEGPFPTRQAALARGTAVAAGSATADDRDACPIDVHDFLHEVPELLGDAVLSIFHDVDSPAGSGGSAVYRVGDRYAIWMEDVGWFGPFTRAELRDMGEYGLALLPPEQGRNHVSGTEVWDFLDCVDPSWAFDNGATEAHVNVAGQPMVVRREPDGRVVWREA